MIRRLTCLLATSCVFFAAADQLQVLESADAGRALEILRTAGVVRHFCDPCGDTDWEQQRFEAIEIVSWGEGGLVEITLDGSSIDLAYIYVETDGGWRNLGHILDLEPFGVPVALEASEVMDDGSSRNALSTRVHTLERRLAELESEADATLSEPAARSFATAADAWRAWRDTEAAFAATLAPGDDHAYDRRAAELTATRVTELESLFGRH